MKRILLILIFSVLGPAHLLAGDSVEGRELFQVRCGDVCHQLPEPGVFKAGQWKLVLGTMEKRMGHIDMKPLDDEELRVILGYLSENAKK